MAGTMPVFAQGGYADAILRMGVASRSEAMGRAYTAVVNNPEAAFYNPAASTTMQARTVDLSLRSLSLDRSFAYVGFATSIKPGSDADSTATGARRPLEGGLALSWITASVSDIEGRDFDGEKFGTYSNNQHIVSFTFALRVHPRLALGISGRLFWNRFPGLANDGSTISARTFGIDAGALFTVTEGVWIGGAFKNLRSSFSWNSEKLYSRGTVTNHPFPRIWRIGAATTRLHKKLLLAADLESSDRQDPQVYVGSEVYLLPQITLRGGIRDGSPTLGAAYVFALGARQTALHYAFVTQPDGVSSEHVFSWSLSF